MDAGGSGAKAFCGPSAGRLNPGRHRHIFELFLDDLRHHGEGQGKVNRESVDRAVVSESKVPEDLARGPIAEYLHRAGTDPVGVGQQLFE